jgi:hypothetical protein
MNEKIAMQMQNSELALHTLGWKAFQDLCSQICEEILKTTVSIYREAQDGGQDAVFLIKSKTKGASSTIATVQCKFTSDPKRRLKLGDINEEIKKIKKLVQEKNADTYYFMTNMGVDAPVAKNIREKLKNLGVIDSHILGKEWITLKIKESARLRALVPRIYGLGDLSIILDERRAQQTRALLQHLVPSLKVYVPTAAHRRAVTVLKKHGIVLLLGAPATGKSMLAAILATTALDDENHRCFQIDGPIELTKYWNPNERGGFYWIDDAFGPNQLRDDYVDQWIASMNKVKAAINSGNRFVLTSRSHIWFAAKNKLATRNHPRFYDGKAIVNVGELSPDESSQILYNHIKAGNQPYDWKCKVKPYLEDLAAESKLLPEIARRLGDKSFTSDIQISSCSLEKFVSEPMDHLKDTISELNDAQKSALTLVFLRRSKLSVKMHDTELWTQVEDKFGVSSVEIGDAFNQLNGTFLVCKSEPNGEFWSFHHPTIVDALSSILGARPDLLELYVQGVRIEELLSDVVCFGNSKIKDAIVIPTSLNEFLISRLIETPDEPDLNTSLFGFLERRASEEVLREVINQKPEILERRSVSYWFIYSDKKIRLHARVHSLGILPDALRQRSAMEIVDAILDEFDYSVFDEDEFLALIQPIQLFRLSTKLRSVLFDSLPDHIESITNDADLDIDPSDNFDDIQEFLDGVEKLFLDDKGVEGCLSEIREQIDFAIETVEENRRKDDAEDWEGEDVQPKKVEATRSCRSIFSDLDE